MVFSSRFSIWSMKNCIFDTYNQDILTFEYNYATFYRSTQNFLIYYKPNNSLL